MKTLAVMMWLLLLLVPACVCLGSNSAPHLNGVAAAVGIPRRAAAADYQLPLDFFENKCDPCISRTESVIQVMVASSSSPSSSTTWSSSKSSSAGTSPEQWDYVRSAMEQASRDTDIRLEFSVYDDKDSEAMAADIRELAQERQVDALIVALPSSSATASMVEEAVVDALQAGLPIFGFDAGYQTAPDVGFLGFVAQDEFNAGQLVGQELLDRLGVEVEELKETTSNRNMKALFITGFNAQDAGVQDRFHGIKSAFDNFFVDSDNSNTSTSSIQIELQAAALDLDPTIPGTTVTNANANGNGNDTTFMEVLSQEIFQDCPYDIVIADGDVTAEIVMAALEESEEVHGCNQTGVLVATFGLSPQIHQGILQGTIAFAATPQLYLQSVFVVLMASIFVTTGKKLALPIDSNNIYLSGPSIYALDDRNRLPENSITKCKELAFPICDPESIEEAPFDSPILSSALAAPVSDSRTCNARGCLNRADIRIAGVLHGVTTSLFWRPIYAGAHRIAEDLGVTLEMAPFEPTQSPEIMWAKMGAKIRSLCESGVDGLIVTIPDEALLEPIRYCQSLEVPILSINSGAQFSEQLGLMVHIGQMEYNAGYGAGERLIDEGMKEGYCLIHNLGNIALQSRCQGFEDAISEHEDIVYQGMVEVSGDDVARSILAVETAVEKISGLKSWDGIALLSLSMSMIDAILELFEKHPEVMLATFDFGDKLYEPLDDGRLKFAIDQQSLLQGIMPVYLLTYAAYTKQALVNQVVETGPHFVYAPPSADQQICEQLHFNTCAEIPVEEMNMLPSELVAIGYFMVALTLVAAVICAAWTKYYWSRSELVHVSQPPFLFTLVAGVVISTLSILFMSVEADYPTTKSTLTGLLTDESSPDVGKANAACMAVPWLHSIGSAIVFASLFGKIWKIKLIYQAGARFRRVTVGLKDVLPCALLLLAVVMSLLTAWQIADPFIWTRNVVLENSDGLALESYGECTSDHGWYFWIALLAFQLAYLIYALVLCWQTKEIPTSFAESNHVSLCVVCIFQVSVLAIPITVMVREDTTAYYFVRACAVFLQNFTVLCLIFGPKMWRVHKGLDKMTIRTSSVTTQGQSWTQRNYPQNSDESPGSRGQPRGDLRSENAELKLHILDLEAVGKGSAPSKENVDAPKEEPKKEATSDDTADALKVEPLSKDNADTSKDELTEEQIE